MSATDLAIRLTGITILDRPPAEDGVQLVAAFDCELGPIAFAGCTLLRTPKGGLTVSLPRLNAKGPRRGAAITDNSIRARLMEAARTAYRAIGGTQAEWLPREQDDPERATQG